MTAGRTPGYFSMCIFTQYCLANMKDNGGVSRSPSSIPHCLIECGLRIISCLYPRFLPVVCFSSSFTSEFFYRNLKVLTHLTRICCTNANFSNLVFYLASQTKYIYYSFPVRGVKQLCQVCSNQSSAWLVQFKRVPIMYCNTHISLRSNQYLSLDT